MTSETFQAVKFGGPKGGLGRAQRAGAAAGATGERRGRKRGAGRWRTVVAKRASRRRVGRSGQATQTIQLSPSISGKRDVQDRWWILDPL